MTLLYWPTIKHGIHLVEKTYDAQGLPRFRQCGVLWGTPS